MKTQKHQWMIHRENTGYIAWTNSDSKKDCIHNFLTERKSRNWSEFKNSGYSCRKVLFQGEWIMKTIKISVRNIKVDSKHFSFDFTVWVNGKKFEKSNYNSSHLWNTLSEQIKFEKILKKYQAYNIVLENMDSLRNAKWKKTGQYLKEYSTTIVKKDT